MPQMNSTTPAFLVRLISLAIILSAIATVSCVPQPIACEVMTLDRNETFEVLSRYGRSYFDTDCTTSVPKEVLVKG
jgi:hypothetical protein